jgi:uncharacterized protein (TIGR02646 family)
MIKLNRSTKPVELTSALQTTLTDEFKLTGKSVWDLKWLKDALLAFSNNKCCYCEADISEESKYMEVEHFHHKDLYKDEVLEWTNLLPSCKRCNGTKNDHDTKNEPIIDPSAVDPKMHLKYWRYRIKGKDDLGKLTISVLGLNNADRIVKKRYEIGNAIQERLESINELLDDFLGGIQTSTRRKNSIVSKIKQLMKEGLPGAIYSACTASIIISDVEYTSAKSKLVKCALWDSELAQLETALQKCAFDI